MRHSSHPATTRGHTHGAPRLYDAFVGIFFFGRRRATFEALIAVAGVQPGQRVLDVGRGTGYFARLLARAVGPEGLVVGIDPSPEMIACATRKAGRASTCRFQVGAAESLDFPADHFDVVVSSLMLHHLPEDLRVPALREMRRVLRPGGTLLVAEAQIARRGLGWRLLARLHGYDRMARMVPYLEPLAARPGSPRSAPARLRRGCATRTRSRPRAPRDATQSDTARASYNAPDNDYPAPDGPACCLRVFSPGSIVDTGTERTYEFGNGNALVSRRGFTRFESSRGGYARG
jgi:ubiquinone/menaquinone biosynthesis C-methylase UbiE